MLGAALQHPALKRPLDLSGSFSHAFPWRLSSAAAASRLRAALSLSPAFTMSLPFFPCPHFLYLSPPSLLPFFPPPPPSLLHRCPHCSGCVPPHPTLWSMPGSSAPHLTAGDPHSFFQFNPLPAALPWWPLTQNLFCITAIVGGGSNCERLFGFSVGRASQRQQSPLQSQPRGIPACVRRLKPH